MTRRFFLVGVCLAGAGRVTLRGRLVAGPALRTGDGKLVPLGGDESTLAVLGDPRLAGLELEVKGRPGEGGSFVLDPFHTRSLFVLRDGRRLVVTYWCEVCSIRAYTPGKCQCCQEETRLDLREAEDK